LKTLFAVTRTPGPARDPARPREQQVGWPEHARFMNELAAVGFIVLGGPIGDGRCALLIVDASDEATINATLAEDPWSTSGHLMTDAIHPWTIVLDASESRTQPRVTG